MPLLRATGAGVRHRRRWVFRDLDLTVGPGDIVGVVGPPGSGRTTVLLALVKRFRLTTGTVALGGPAALGHVPDVEHPEAVFTVAEHVRERLALLGRPAHEAEHVIAGGLLGLDPAIKGWELTPYERQLLGLVLAQLERPQVIALDGPDDGLDAGERARLWAELARIAATGVAVLVTAREVHDDQVTTVVSLDDPRPSHDRTAIEYAQAVPSADVWKDARPALPAKPPKGTSADLSAEVREESSPALPAKPPGDASADLSTKAPADLSAEGPTDLWIEALMDAQADLSGDPSVEVRADAGADLSVEVRADAGADLSVEVRTDAGADLSVEVRADLSGDPSAGVPEGASADGSADRSADSWDERANGGES